MKNTKLLVILGIAALIIVGILLFTTLGTTNPTPVETQTQSQTPTLPPAGETTEPQKVIFKGTSPCADCPGIDVVLTLKYDGRTSTEGSYTQTMTYQEKSVEPVTDTGTWKGLPNDIIELTPSGANAAKQYYLQTQADTLEALGADQQKLPSPYNYTLVAGE